jgi:hypothetical protein
MGKEKFGVTGYSQKQEHSAILLTGGALQKKTLMNLSCKTSIAVDT